MKYSLIILMALFTLPTIAQKPAVNTDTNGVIADGYDVTEYFNDKAVKGKDAHTSTYEGATYKFVSEANKQKFDANPDKFAPKYGGYCAYAVADSDKVGIDPESYLIQDGELLLFYNGLFADTRKKWNKKGAQELKVKADKNWQKIKNN